MVRKTDQRQLTKVAVGYVRRSTDKQEQSIDDQKRALSSYATEYGLCLNRFYIDDAISGTSVRHRHAFQEMLDDAKDPAQSFSTIVVYDIKRFGRVDNDEAGYYRHILRTHGVEIRYVCENFNGDTTDDLLRPVKQWQARQESKDLSKVTIRGLLSKVQTGTWMGGVPPYGYDLRYQSEDGQFLLIQRFMPDGTKQIYDEKGKHIRTLQKGESLTLSKRDSAKLVLSDPHRVKLIRRIFSMYVDQGMGFKAIAHTLNLEGHATPRNSKWASIYSGRWTCTTIRSILVNPLYVGDSVWNRRTDARFYKIQDGHAVDRDGIYGARLVPNGETDWITIRDAHEAIISRRLFEKTRQRLNKVRGDNHGKSWHGKRSQFILSGLMQCALCGSGYQGSTSTSSKKRKDGTSWKHRYYACGGYITKGKAVCDSMHAVSKELLEETVIESILSYYRQYEGQDGRERLANAIKAQVGTEVIELETAQARATQEQQEITQTINNLLDNITATNRDLVDRRLNELKHRLQNVDNRLTELDQLAKSQVQIKQLVQETTRFLHQLELVLKEGEPHERLVSLRQCITKIEVDKPQNQLNIEVYTVPCGGINKTETLSSSIPN